MIGRGRSSRQDRGAGRGGRGTGRSEHRGSERGNQKGDADQMRVTWEKLAQHIGTTCGHYELHNKGRQGRSGGRAVDRANSYAGDES